MDCVTRNQNHRITDVQFHGIKCFQSSSWYMEYNKERDKSTYQASEKAQDRAQSYTRIRRTRKGFDREGQCLEMALQLP